MIFLLSIRLVNECCALTQNVHVSIPGDVIIFIINHLDDKSVVERFTYDDKSNTLSHLDTIESDDFGV